MSVLIVSWNARDYLQACLNSIRTANPPCVKEIIVIDNASSDGSPEMVERDFPNVRLVRSGANLGFAGGNNLAMRIASGSSLAFVNSDALVHHGCLETLHEHLVQNPRVGLAGPLVTGADGNLQRSSRHLPSLWNTFCRTFALDRAFAARGTFSGYELPVAEHARLHDAAVLSGCFWLARTDAARQVGPLDEQFFFYGEDIDWCKRFGDAGWKLSFLPAARATHFGGGSSANAPLKYSVEMLRATLKYWRKHHGPMGEVACLQLLIAHHGLRLSARSLQRLVGLGRSVQSRRKYSEDVTCLRWLLFRTEPAASPRTPVIA